MEGERFRMMMEEGAGEVFGSQLERGKWYDMTEERFPVFTVSGCRLVVEGHCTVEVSKSSSMPMFQRISEDIKQEAAATHRTPRVLIAGPCDSGKSSLSKVLANYRVSEGSKVIFVDVDPGQSLSLPGSISAVAIHSPLPIVHSFDGLVPFSFFTGHTSPAGSPHHFSCQMRHLASAVDSVVTANDTFSRGGIIVNSCGWIEEFGLQVLKDSIQDFSINFVVVMGSDSLYSHLRSEFPRLRVEFMPVSTGVVSRTKVVRYQNRMKKIRDYFFGSTLKLTPHTQSYDYTEFVFLRHDPSSSSSSSSSASQYTPLPAHEVPSLQGHLLALSNSPSLAAVSQWNVAGFVIVREVSERTRQITLLSPNSRPFPSPYLLVGTVIANGF